MWRSYVKPIFIDTIIITVLYNNYTRMFCELNMCKRCKNQSIKIAKPIIYWYTRSLPEHNSYIAKGQFVLLIWLICKCFSPAKCFSNTSSVGRLSASYAIIDAIMNGCSLCMGKFFSFFLSAWQLKIAACTLLQLQAALHVLMLLAMFCFCSKTKR